MKILKNVVYIWTCIYTYYIYRHFYTTSSSSLISYTKQWSIYFCFCSSAVRSSCRIESIEKISVRIPQRDFMFRQTQLNEHVYAIVDQFILYLNYNYILRADTMIVEFPWKTYSTNKIFMQNSKITYIYKYMNIHISTFVLFFFRFVSEIMTNMQ